MKGLKKVAAFLSVLMVTSTFVACDNSENKNKDKGSSIIEDKAKFKEEASGITCTDLENSPFEKGGLNIIVKNKDEKSIRFTITSDQGINTTDYYLFDFDNNIMREYSHISQEEEGYYYTVDLKTLEITKIESREKKDVTETMKSKEDFNEKESEIKKDIALLQNYFKDKYGVSMEEAVEDSNFGK